MPRLTVAHDFICPWCWVARRQAERLREEFPAIEFIWKGYELLPEGLPYTPSPPDPDASRKPPVPSRFELMLLAEGLKLPKRNRKTSNSRLALEGAEYALSVGKQEAYLDAVYFAYWEGNSDISDMKTLTQCAEEAGLDAKAFAEAVRVRVYRDDVIEYDDPAHEAGVWNVPTWKFEGDWVAETPYATLRLKVSKLIEESQTQS